MQTNRAVAFCTFWVFQAINGVSGVGLLLFPRAFHEGMFADPARAYALLGFSDTAVEMLHNVLRGQGAALLAVSLFLFFTGPKERRSFVLIALVCVLSLVAHLFTLWQHLDSDVVRRAISSFGALYGLIALNILLALGAVFAGSRTAS